MQEISNNVVNNKKLLYLLSLLSIIGQTIDVIFGDLSTHVEYINIINVIVLIITLILVRFSIISINKSFFVVVYSLIFNIIISHYVDMDSFTDFDALRSILIIVLILPVSVFILGKKHSFYIGGIVLTLYVLFTFFSNSQYLSHNLYLVSILLFGYSIGMYYLKYILEERTKGEKILLSKLKTINKDSVFLKTLAFELADFSTESDFIALIIKKIKQHTEARFAVFNLYDPEKKVLTVKGIEADGALLKTAIEIAGKKILNASSPINDEVYNKMLNEKVGFGNSLTEISFGAIPKKTDIAFRNLTGINQYFAIAHIVNGQIYGTTLLGLKKSQSFPSIELLKSYSHLAALYLRRNIAEKALLISESKLRRINDNISDVVITMDTKFNTTFVSPSIALLTGESPESFSKRTMKEKHPASSLAKIKSIIREEIVVEKDPNVDKNRTRVIDLELIKPDGSIIHISTHLSFIRNKSNEIIGYQGVTRDITEIVKTQDKLKSYAEELKKLNADKDLFMQILAHDLRNPFNTLLGFSSVLIENFKEFELEKTENILKIINETAQKTYNLLEDLLIWSKSKSGKLEFNPEYLMLPEIIEDVVSGLKIAANKKNLSIDFSFLPIIKIVGDNNMLRAIFRNLISNAIKFSKNDGEISISGTLNENSVFISVSDNGVGISEENQKKLWNSSKPFSTSGTDNEKGTGLGLFICKEFAEKHKGKIFLDSKEGKGSVFTIQLPVNGILQIEEMS